MQLQQTATAEERLRRRLAGIGNLPTPPVVFTQISKVMNDPSTSVKKIAAIMSEDPAMSAKVLRLSNSAYFGVRNEITHISQAVLVLGLDAIKALVLSSAVFDMFKDKNIDAEYQDRFWRHSLATAIAARLLSKHGKLALSCESEIAFSAGLLHDIGKLIICCFMPEDHRAIRALAKEKGCSDLEAEKETIGYSHTLVGTMLAESWKLPLLIRTAIADHHSPGSPDSPGSQYSALVHVANYLSVKTFDPDVLKSGAGSILQPEVLDQLELSEEDLETLSAELLESYSRSTTFVQMAMSA